MSAEHDPDWVLSVDADEIYHCQTNPYMPSPVAAVEAAEEAGANVVVCEVPQFWLTFADLRNGAFQEDEGQSVQERRRWYSWGHQGVFMWKWNPEHYYPPECPKRTPELPGLSWRQWQMPGARGTDAALLQPAGEGDPRLREGYYVGRDGRPVVGGKR